MGKKLDRRVQRTRRLLHEALMALILESGFDSITVQDITDRADLSRATFYLHYKDKEELLINSLEAMFDALTATILPLSPETFLVSGRPPSLLAFEHVQENRHLYKALLGERGVAYVMSRILQYLSTTMEEQIERILPEGTQPSVPVSLLARHLAGSLFSLIIWWLENDLPESPERMAQTFHQMAIPGVLNALGIAGDVADFSAD
jgi:AcrR family transcriptional regulator